MYNSRHVEIHVGLKVPTAVPQKEIILSDFNFCFSCRAGACPKHAGPGTSFSSIQDAQQQEQSTRQGVSLLARLPVELACQVALALPSQTFFSIRHIPELEAFWAANGDYLVREKAAQYAAEAQFFPADLFTGGGGSSILAQHQQLLYLEVIRTCTTAVTDYLTTTLDLPTALSARLHAAVLRLWRVVGVAHRSSAAHMRQEAMNNFCSLPQAERADIFALFADVGEYIERAHPFAQRLRADNVAAPDDDVPEMDEIVATGAFKHILGFLAMESIRAAMRGAFALAAEPAAAAGRMTSNDDVDADAVEEAVDEMRLGAPLWTVWDPDHGEVEHEYDEFERFIPTDVWTYSIMMDHDPHGSIRLDAPDGHRSAGWFVSRDDYIAFGMARLLPDGWTLETRTFYTVFGWGIWFSRTAVGGKVGAPWINRVKFDDEFASDDDKAETMQNLMRIAFRLVPDEFQ